LRRRKDGRLVPISLTVSPVRNEAGTVIGASKIARDISERHEAQRVLLEAQAAQGDLQRRLLALVSASKTLLVSPRVEDVVPATLTLATQVISADGYAVWRPEPGSGAWRIGAYQGISEAFAAATIAGVGADTIKATPEWPVALEDVHAGTLAPERVALYETEGIRSLLAVPLTIAGEFAGTVTFYCRAPRSFSDVEKQTAMALGNLASAAITTAGLYDAQRRARVQSEFLADAAAALAASLDYHETLTRVAELAVPHLADWCAVDLIGENEELGRLTIAHVDPAKAELARQHQARFPADPRSAYGPHHVIRTGAPVLLEQLTDELLIAEAGSEEHLQALRTLGVTSFMVVPIVARGGTLGAMTFVSAQSRRRYSRADLQFAQDVAYRAGLAVDNARAYAEARRANQLKDDFLATLSHELRTPLNAILGYARMLRNGVVEPEKQPRAIEIIERNAASLTQIVADVLDVSRIVSGKLQLRLEPVDLGRIVTDALDTVAPAAEAKGLRLHSHVDQIGVIDGDAARLQQVVWNLLSNAVKFTPKGGLVQVSAATLDEYVEIVVSDTGCGIPRDFLPFVFERFRQADSRFTREHGGLGLGLAIARHIVDLHGGTMSAESEGLGAGATFRVRLPVAPVRRRRRPPARPLKESRTTAAE
jgi:signal transduction histidine kinase